MSIASQCRDCCLLALRGRVSYNLAKGFESPLFGLDKFITQTANSVAIEYSTAGRFDELAISYTANTRRETLNGSASYEAIEPTEANSHPDPRELEIPFSETPSGTNTINNEQVFGSSPFGIPLTPDTYTASNPFYGSPDSFIGLGVFACGINNNNYGNVDVLYGPKLNIAEDSYTWSNGIPFSGANYPSTIGYIGDESALFNASGDITVTTRDSYSSVRSRLTAAQADGWAFGSYGSLDINDYHSFDDSAWPGLGYYSAAGGTYYGLWQIFNPIGGCVYGGGETGDLSLYSNTTNFGLPMADHPYFKSRYTTYELDVAYNFRRFYQLRDFHGCFSAKGTAVRTLVFEKVIRSCWLKLETIDLCTATTDVTTDTKNDHLYAETEIFDPVDQYGSTEYDHASWSNPNCNPRFEGVAWSTDSGDLGVKHSDFCFRNKLLFVSSTKVKITVQKTVINYKDIFDDPTNPDWAEVLATQVSAPTVTSSTMELTNEARVSGFFTSETSDDFKVRPSNYRQVVWLKITRVFTTTAGIDKELPLSTVSLYCARRYGNMGFPQLNDQAAGALYKGVRGFKKTSRWFSKLRMVHSETLLSSGSCPTPSCTIYTDTGVDLATEVEFECLQDTALDYDAWTDTRKVFERDWRCTGAISSLGADEWDVPFVDRSGRAPIWGSFGFSSSTATTATTTATTTHNRLQYGIASQSAIPYRYLNAEEQQVQDKIGDAFTIYEGCADNRPCPPGNLTCTEVCTGDRAIEYNECLHASTPTPIADPFYGFDNIVSTSTQTAALNKATTGYFGKKDVDGNRVIEDAISTDVLHFSATTTGTYVTIRNFWLK